MGIITVEGLGSIEIEGDTPNSEEQKAIVKALSELKETEEVDTSGVSADLGDTLESSVNENITSDIVDFNLNKVDKVEGLDKFGLTRPVFEGAGAIFGAVPGAPLGPVGVVAGGTLGATGGGQLYDILQSYITDEPTDFVTQLGKTKKDLQREAVLQSIFMKVPGLFYKMRGFVYGKGDKALYEASKRLGYPLSLSDAGNMIATGYGRVIGIFPYVGDPIKKKILEKSTFLNNQATKTLNTLAPNVSLLKLGVNMEKASRSTFADFKRVSSFFYDDFYKAVDKVGKNTPIISTKNFKDSLNAFVTLVDGGAIKLTTGGKLKGPQRDTLYRYAKSGGKIPAYISSTQYKSLVEDIKYYSRLAATKEPYNLKVLTSLKAALETDLRLLTKKSYRDNLLKNVYPLSKSKQKKLDPDLLSNIAKKLKFADEVYANGVENSILSNTLKKKLSKESIESGVVPGKKAFDQPIASEFKKVDKNIFGLGFQKPGSITADQLGEALLKRNASPQLLDDLRTLVGEKQFKKFVRSKLQKAYDSSLIQSRTKPGELKFDPYKFEENLGLTTEKGRDLFKSLTKGSKLDIQQLDDFFLIAKNHAGLKIPDVSSFLARRGVLGGFKSLSGGAIIGLGAGVNPLATSALFLFSRKTSRMLSNPGALKKVMVAIDSNAPIFQRKTATLKLIDAAISDSTTKQEENDFRSLRELIENLSVDDLKKGAEETLESSQEFLNMNAETGGDTEQIQSIEGDTSQIPVRRVPPLQTANVNPNLLAQAPTGVQTLASGLTPTESALLSPEEQAIRLRSRGLA